MGLDRAVAGRLDPVWVERRLEDPASRAVVASAEGVLVTSAPLASLLRVPVAADRAARGADEPWPVILGLDDGVALFAIDLDAQPPEIRRRLNEQGRIATL